MNAPEGPSSFIRRGPKFEGKLSVTRCLQKLSERPKFEAVAGGLRRLYATARVLFLPTFVPYSAG